MKLLHCKCMFRISILFWCFCFHFRSVKNDITPDIVWWSNNAWFRMLQYHPNLSLNKFIICGKESDTAGCSKLHRTVECLKHQLAWYGEEISRTRIRESTKWWTVWYQYRTAVGWKHSSKNASFRWIFNCNGFK